VLWYNVRFFRGVAQPGSVPAWGAGGREFESHRPDHLIPINIVSENSRLAKYEDSSE
jgi:hypothetical protein